MSIRNRAKRLKHQTMVAYYAARNPRTPWFVRLLALAVTAYALSPIDLIPDFIPILGYLDDLIIVPPGLALVVHLMPADVAASAREQALAAAVRPTSRIMAVAVAILWALTLDGLGWWLFRSVRT